MKKMKVLVALMLVALLSIGSAMACTSLFVGAALNVDGVAAFGRSEDYSNSHNKLMYVSPAGKHVAGEEYAGCYGFTYTFTHDSYSYTAFSDDNGEGVEYECPDCGSTHAHTPYEAGGTNEKGFTMTATETLYGSDVASEADPFEDLGIEEAEITTILLSEAASAKEALTILTGIYDTAGCNAGSGIILADCNEAWYIENVTGHEYIAVKLNDNMLFLEPNVSIIGLIDLDDTENVVASAGIMAVAQAGGFFVGDAEKNQINYNASYNAGASCGARMKDGLAYLNAKYDFSETEPDVALYSITNVDAEGNIVPMHTNIEPEKVYTFTDILGLWDVSGIGKAGNLETHVFQVAKEAGLTGICEWVAMDDAQMTVFVPYLPMLTTDVAASYKVSTAMPGFAQEATDATVCYPTSKRVWTPEGVVMQEGFCTLPENWADSFYWAVDALSNIVEYGGKLEEKENVMAAMNAKQQEVIAAFEAVKADVLAAATVEEAQNIATSYSMNCANEVWQMTVQLANELLAK